MTTAIGYARVSSQEQKYGATIQLQEQAILQHASTAGWQLLRIERDEARSGSNGLDTRDGLAAALAALESGEADVLVITEWARLARDLVLQETIVGQLERAGRRVVAVLEPDAWGDDATRTLIRQVLGAVKQYERAVIRARMEAGRARAVAEGRRGQGGPPYGWRAEAGRLVAIQEEQATIARMVQLRDEEHLTASAIAERLNQEGRLARRGRWHPATVAKVLRRVDSG